MKKISFQLIAVSIITFCITSCSNDNKEPIVDPDARVAVEIQTGMDTRATDATWQRSDKIGITMYDPDYTNILENQFNRGYITSARLGTFTPLDQEEIVYFPQDGSDMRLKSYYPFIENLPENMIINWSVANQDSLPLVDLMTAEHISGFNRQSDLVYLHFSHQLSKLIFLLDTEEDTQGVTLSDCELTISGMLTAKDYNLFDDTWGNNEVGPADIIVPLRDGEDGDERVAIVLPSPEGQDVEFKFTTPDGSTYTAVMSPDLILQGGKQYIFYIVLGRNPTIVYATIENWETGGTDTLTAR